MDLVTILGSNIRDLREEMDMKQYQLADLLQLDASYVSVIEGGKRDLPFSTLMHFCDALKTNPDTIAKGCFSYKTDTLSKTDWEILEVFKDYTPDEKKEILNFLQSTKNLIDIFRKGGIK